MARVIFSPIISSMSGKVADAVFSVWKGIHYIRSRVIPSNPQSADQTAQRDALKHTLTMWQSIKGGSKGPWDHFASGYAWSGYNRYMDHNIMLVKAAVAGLVMPFNADALRISGVDAAAGGAGEITITWTDTGAPANINGIQSLFRKTESGSEVYAWTYDDAGASADETLTIDGLDTGEEYEVALYAYGPNDELYQQSYNEILLAG